MNKSTVPFLSCAPEPEIIRIPGNGPFPITGKELVEH